MKTYLYIIIIFLLFLYIFSILLQNVSRFFVQGLFFIELIFFVDIFRAFTEIKLKIDTFNVYFLKTFGMVKMFKIIKYWFLIN